jgi:hypothetical protein
MRHPEIVADDRDLLRAQGQPLGFRSQKIAHTGAANECRDYPKYCSECRCHFLFTCSWA